MIRYVGFWANPCDLLPEQTGEVFHLITVQGEAVVHEYVYVSLLFGRFDLAKGGEMRCPVEGCDCFQTLGFDLSDKEWTKKLDSLLKRPS